MSINDARLTEAEERAGCISVEGHLRSALGWLKSWRTPGQQFCKEQVIFSLDLAITELKRLTADEEANL